MASIKPVKDKEGKIRGYRARVVVGRYANGAPKQQMRTYRTKREADAASKALETDHDRGLPIDARKVRTAKFLQEWLERKAKQRRASTVAGYKDIVDRFLVPGLGDTVLRDLTVKQIQDWLDTLKTPDIAHRCRRTLHTVLEEAVNLNLLPLNPVDRTRTPTRRRKPPQVWSEEELQRFCAVAAKQAYQPYWLLAMRLPLRLEEVLGLHWHSVDLDTGTLHIQEVVATVGNHSFPDDDTKNETSDRVIDLPEDMVEALRASKEDQDKRRNDLGSLWCDNNLVCAGERGKGIGYNNLRRAFLRMCKEATVTAIPLHNLRHTVITIMAAGGIDIKAISELAGHANVMTTRNIYQAINKKQYAAAIAVLTDILVKPEKPALKIVS
jgi:integrase